MIITPKGTPNEKYVVYGIYWVKRNDGLLRIYAIVDGPDNMAGFEYFEEQEVDILDPSLDNYILVESFFEDDDRFCKELFVHKAAFPSEDFYMALIGHDDPKNVETLFMNMRNLGLEPYFQIR
jgi:hypothetical protein